MEMRLSKSYKGRGDSGFIQKFFYINNNIVKVSFLSIILYIYF